MMKTTGQDNIRTVSPKTDIRQAVRGCVVSIAAIALLASVPASAQTELVAPAPGTRVTITDGQLAEQTAPVTEPRVPAVASSTLPASATFQVSGKRFPADGHFPRSGFTGATFQVLVNGHDAKDNARYQWHSNQTWAVVDPAGTVTFKAMPTATTRTVTLTANPAAGGAPLTTTFSVSRWFINANAEKMTRPAAEAWCPSQGNGFVLPEAAVMTTTTESTPSSRAANGALWNEWGPMALYRSGWQLGNYWASKAQSDKREMVGLVNGNFYWVADSSSYLVTCVRGVQ